MIPQKPSHQLTADQIQKQREYLKQQQRLRLMASSTNTQNVVSADTLINNLLDKKDTFKPAEFVLSNSLSTNKESGTESFKPSVGASQSVAVEWLSPASPNFPHIYRRVWSIVGQTDGLVDTEKVFPLLLTSGLPTDVLGYIWGLVNKSVVGRLTEIELYSLLALVALAQRGYSFNSANVLSLVPQPPIPTLNLGTEPQHTSRVKREDLNLHSQSHMPLTEPLTPQLQPSQLPTASGFQSTATTSHIDDFDDFTDFQSATSATPNCSNSHSQNTEVKESTTSLKKLQSIDMMSESSSAFLSTVPSVDIFDTPEPTFVQKFPTVAVIGGGRSIGSRLANHSLGAPKTAKAKHHKHHHHHHHRNVPPVSVTVDDDFSDFQQATSNDMFTKCSIKSPPSQTYLLKETAIRSEVPSSDNDIGSFPQGVAQVPTNIFSDIVIEKPKSPVKEQSKSPEKGNELMTVEEDRYGALRALSMASEESAGLSVVDDFDDFFSASTTTADNSFVNISTRANSSVSVATEIPWSATDVNNSSELEFTVDEWSNFETAPTTNLPSNEPILFSSSILQSVVEGNGNEGGHSLLMNELSNQMTSINLDHNFSIPLTKVNHAALTNCSNSKIFDSDIPPFNQVPGILSASPNNIIPSIVESNEDDFGDFVGPDAWVEERKQTNNQVHNATVTEPNVSSLACSWLDDSKSTDEQIWPDDVSSKMNKEGVLDNHLVSSLWLEETKNLDSQSVSSLELPGLDQAWDTMSEWRKCLQNCIPIFQLAADTLGSVTDESILQEVLGSAQGQNYLRDLFEVWSVCDRIRTSYQQQGTTDHKLDPLLHSTHSVWESLKMHYTQAQIPFESVSTPDGQETCCICLVAGAKVEFEGHNYHAPCANLWLHFVDTVLPVLQS